MGGEAEGQVMWKQVVGSLHGQKKYPADECPRCENYKLYEHREPEFEKYREMTWKEKIKHFFHTFIDLHGVKVKPNREVSGYIRYQSCDNCGYSTEPENVGEEYYD